MLSPAKTFILLCSAFFLGIFLGYFIPFHFTILLLLIILFLILSLLFYTEAKIRLMLLVVLFLILGIFRWGLSEPVSGKTNLAYYNGRSVIIKGIIIEEPDVRQNKTNLVLSVEQLKLENTATWEMVKGKVLMQTKLYPQYQYGDQLAVEGELETPPEFPDFSYRDYLSRYGIYSTMRNPAIEKLADHQGNPIRHFMIDIKTKFAEKIGQTLPEPQASLLAGILYGAKRGIPSDIMEAFNRTGLTHIVVISGYNITIIASLLLAILGFLPRRWSFLLTLGGILLFVVFVGASPSVVRAAIMGAIGLLAFHVKRKNDVFTALLFAAFLMILWNPKVLRFDTGFQLSFLATAGLIFLAPLLEKFFKFLPSILAEAVSLTLAAQCWTMPIILYNFGRLSLIAPLANALVLPVIPFLMTFGFLGTVVGFCSIIIGQFMNWSSWALLTYIIKVAEGLSRIPLASLEFKIPVFGLGVYYSLLILAMVWRNKRVRVLNPKL